MYQSTLPMRLVSQAGHKGEGHRVCKVGADDADGRQPRIKKVEHGQAQGASTHGAQGYKHAEHCTEHHSDRTRVAVRDGSSARARA